MSVSACVDPGRHWYWYCRYSNKITNPRGRKSPNSTCSHVIANASARQNRRHGFSLYSRFERCGFGFSRMLLTAICQRQGDGEKSGTYDKRPALSELKLWL